MRGRIVLFLTLLSISWSTQHDSDVAASSAEQKRNRIAQAVNEFGYKLMLNMMKETPNENIVVSPTGIAGLLAMTLLGSVGSTYDELAQALGFSQDILANRKNHEQFGDLLKELNVNAKIDAADFRMNGNGTMDASELENKIEDTLSRTLYADAIVVDSNALIRAPYRNYLDKVYHGDALTAQFRDAVASQQLINDWVRNHTEGRIPEFLTEQLPVTTKVVLLSALYFSGQWARPFLPEYTMNMTFHKPSADVLAELMLNVGPFHRVFKLQFDMHMIALPYNDSETTMYVIKPFRGRKTNLSSIMEQLDYSTIDQLIQNMSSEDCVVRFPKMDLSTNAALQSSLKALGIKSMFEPGKANFALLVDSENKKKDDDVLSRITENDDEVTRTIKGNDEKKLRDTVNNLPNPGIYVDSVLHDVKMNINEYGTVAVAATGGFTSRTLRQFYVDSPFYMFIRNEKTRLITFSAVIYDPTKT